MRTMCTLFALLLALVFTCLAAARPEVRVPSWRMEVRDQGVQPILDDHGNQVGAWWSFDEYLVSEDGDERYIGSVEGDFASWPAIELWLSMLRQSEPQSAQNPTVLEQAKKSCYESTVIGCCGSLPPPGQPPCPKYCWFVFSVVGGGGITNCSGACTPTFGSCPPKPGPTTPGAPGAPA